MLRALRSDLLIQRRATFVALASLVALGGSCSDGEVESEPHSALLITMDTTRADALACYGVVPNATDNLNRLATEGVLYERAYAVAPITLPSHSSMMTGLVPLRHGVRVNGVSALPDAAETLAEKANAAGVQTAAFIAAVVLDASFGLAQGFETYEGPDPSLQTQSTVYDQRPAEEVVDSALAWLKERDPERPFFLWVHLFDPHTPYAPPAEFLEKAPDKNPYLGEVAYADYQLGRLLLALTLDGTLDETFVMVVGDHGESMGEHDESQHVAYCYNTTLRVPMILRYPDGYSAGKRTGRTASVVDVAPTLAEALGLGPLSDIDGQSLFKREIAPDRGAYFESYYGYLSYGWSPLAGWVDRTGKYLHSSEPEFYDMRKDPLETRDLMGTGPDVERYRAALDRISQRPRLEPGVAARDAELLEKIQNLGYAAAGSVEETLPDPLDPSDRPSPKSRAREQWELQNAMFHAAQGRYEEALAKLREIYAANPFNAEAVDHMTACLMRLQRVEEAIEPLRSVLSRSPNRPDTLTYLGVCLLLLERHEEAREPLARALEIQPDHLQALAAMSQLLELDGKTEEARQLRERVGQKTGQGS